MYAKSARAERQRGKSIASIQAGIGSLSKGDPDVEAGGADPRDAWLASQGMQQALVAQLLEARELEQQRIATDLHDTLGQSLTLMKFSVDESLKLLNENKITRAAEMLQRLSLTAGSAMGELRQVIMNLRPAMLDDLGILATLSWFFRELETVCRGMKIQTHFNVREDCIPAMLRVTIFRIIQEATNNIMKHAHADRIRVGMEIVASTLHLSIEDNGDGFDPARCRASIGLLSMKERAEISGGRYVMKAAPGAGTRIAVSWQLDNLGLAKAGSRFD